MKNKVIFVIGLVLIIFGIAGLIAQNRNNSDYESYAESEPDIEPEVEIEVEAEIEPEIEPEIEAGDETEPQPETEEVYTKEWNYDLDDNVIESNKIEADIVFTGNEVGSYELPVDFMIIPDTYEYDYNVYSMVAMALERYYDGNVDEVFDFDFQRDIGEVVTNMIFNVSVNSESHHLNMLIDAYGLKVVITEV